MIQGVDNLLDLEKELTLKAVLTNRHELILKIPPQWCNSAFNFNLSNIEIGGLVNKDKLDGTPYGSQKVKYLCKKKVPIERKNDLTILNEIEYFQPYQHFNEVSEFYPMEYVLKGLIRTLDGVQYRALVTQPQVWSAAAFEDIEKWEKIEVEV